ncbi:hypothetical protein LLEC1_06337 [Akanthomyces lecanii]|uniref:Uncharacterized protein n=1 Tax=Cordyceps confragosa TaxID=2714763 RepID=A0A179I098_CORDF|nr:hypothetical protein LLEC1_06337 [Akanthomyces lecanii]
MSVPHRGLPPPAGMPLPSQQGAATHAPVHQPSHQPPPPSHHGRQPSMPPQQPPSAPSHHHHRDSWGGAPGPAGPLPPAPQHWNSDEHMRNWLQAKTEEEKTRQEEERTRQEGLRLEQRRIEMEMLRSSLGGGIPPPMIPLVFTGMASGGVLPQAALDWAHQFMNTQQSHYPQLPPPPPRPISPESQREAVAQATSQYHPTNPPPPAHGGGYAAYATSPTRARGQSVSGVIARPAAGSNLSSAGTNTPQSGGLQPSTSTLGPFQLHQPTGGQSNQQDSELYFHHWQPPVTQSGQSAGPSNRPSSPVGEPQKKRKAGADPPQHSRASSSAQRPRSPPSLSQNEYGGAPVRKLHKRHKSDVSWYHGPRHGMGSSHESARRDPTPARDNSSTSSKDREAPEETQSRLRREDDGQARDRDREREVAAHPGERAA